MRRGAWGIVLACLALVGAGYWVRGGAGHGPAGEVRPASEEAVPLVETAAVTQGEVRRSLPLTGVLRASREVALSAPVPGRLAEMLVRAGDRVAAGQEIARLESPELAAQVEQARAGVTAARARLAQAEKSLPLQNAAREMEIRQADESVAAALARLAQAEENARMAAAEADADVRKAEAGLEAARAQIALVRRGPRPEQVRQAEAQLAQARAGYEAAKKGLARAQFLHDKGGLPRAQLEAVQAEHDATKAQVDAAEQQVALVRAGAGAEEVRQVEQQVRQAEAGLEAARAGAGRKQISLREVDAARTQVHQAMTASAAARGARKQAAVQHEDVAAARAAVQQAEAGARAAEAQWANTELRAPVAGLVSKTHAQAGETIMPGSPVAVIVSLAGVTFEAMVSERDRRALAPGMRALIRAAEGPRVLPGTVRDVLPVAEADNRSFRVRVSLDGEPAGLTPGAHARADVELYRAGRALLLPQETLVGEEDRWYVWQVVDGRVHRREVQAGANTGGRAEIRAGIVPGDRVVLNPDESLSEGDAVRTAPR